MLSVIMTPALWGMEVFLVEVEVDVTLGVPGFSMVGLPDSAVREARERVGAALNNSGFSLSPRRYTINLAPADRRKEGASFDLALALGILMGMELIPQLPKAMFVGELALNGSLRPVKGLIAMAQLAKEKEIPLVFPKSQVKEIIGLKGLKCFPVSSLRDALNVKEENFISLYNYKAQHSVPDTDFSQIFGLPMQKRAMEIAAAGGHHILFTGVPGTGKSLCAKAFLSILPQIPSEMWAESARIYSAIGKLLEMGCRPFRSPHHSSSSVALLGGGSPLKPGEISLSHNGVLFLDELAEFPRAALEGLREPLEEGQIYLSRSLDQQKFPANFQLIAAMNPCPCGFQGSQEKVCLCTAADLSRYKKKLSGPLIDRFDLVVPFFETQADQWLKVGSEENSENVRERVKKAQEIQGQRCDTLNTKLDASYFQLLLRKDKLLYDLLQSLRESLRLSPRGQLRCLRVAQTIADLAKENLQEKHLWEATQYRMQL